MWTSLYKLFMPSNRHIWCTIGKKLCNLIASSNTLNEICNQKPPSLKSIKRIIHLHCTLDQISRLIFNYEPLASIEALLRNLTWLTEKFIVQNSDDDKVTKNDMITQGKSQKLTSATNGQSLLNCLFNHLTCSARQHETNILLRK